MPSLFGIIFNGSKTIKKVVKILKYIGIVLILFILLIQFFLWTSVGQTMVGKMATSYLENHLGTVVNIKKVDISFFKFVRLEEVYVEDQNQDTLFYIKNLAIEIGTFSFENDSVLINLGLVQIENPVYNLQQIKADSFTNLSFLIDGFSSNDTITSNSQVLINASDIVITNGHFIWDNDNYPEIDFGINWDHIDLDSINLNISNFQMVNDSFNGDFEHLDWIEKSGFVLNNFTGKAIFSSTTTQVEGLHLTTPYSDIKVDIDYQYDSIASYVEFNEQVYMRYKLDSSIINFKDISYFAPALEGTDYSVIAFGKERGPVSDMKLQDIYLAYGEATIIYGRIFINGLPNLESTYITSKFKKLSTDYQDLATIKSYPFTKGKTLDIPTFLKNSGELTYVGNFTGFYNNFVSYGTLKSNNGIINTDIQLAQESSGTFNYSGRISTINFDLGHISTHPELLGRASLDIKIKGQNLDFESADLTVKGHATRLDFNGYKYTNVSIDAAIKDQAITGLFSVVDTNLNLSFNGEINLKSEIPRYKFTAEIGHLRPNQLHFMERDSSASLSTSVVFNFQGNSLDNILGRAGLRNFNFVENNKSVHLDKVDFLGFTTGKDKTLALTSDNIELQITGEFYFQELVQSLNYLLSKWLPSIYDVPPIKPTSVENFHLVLNAHKFSGFSAIFIPQVTFDNDLKIDFKFNSELEQINLEASSSNMKIVGKNIEGMHLTAQLTSDSFNLISEIDTFLLTDSNQLKNIRINAIASENLVQTNLNWHDLAMGEGNSGDISFGLEFTNPDKFKIGFNESWVSINDTLWNMHDSSKISKDHKEYAFTNVSFTNTEQDFIMNGFISEDPSKELTIEVDSFNLTLLNPIINKFNINITGVLDGKTNMSDVYGNLKLISNMNFNQLTFNNQKIGSGHINSLWDNQEQKFNVDVDFNVENYKTLKLTGSYYPQYSTESLDLTLQMDHLPAKITEPFLKDYIDQIAGSVSGFATIKGTLKEPLVNGDFRLNNIETRVIYLNEKLYANNQSVFIRPNLIGADVVTIKDSQGKKAQVNFSLFHHNYQDINFDLSITSKDVFRAFNTTKKDNDYFYGKVMLSPGSTVGIESDYDGNLNLTANIVSGQGTKVTIPFYEDDEVDKKDYIYFKDVTITTEKIKEEDLVQEKNTGLNLDLSMDLNKNAEVQLIFDEFTNDKIVAKGDGSINIKLNEEEDFSIYGNYEIDEGYYLFTFSKVISKKFTINSGSRLTWNGDPYEGQADIEAEYKVRTTLLELGITAAYDSTELTKRVPVEVVLKMTGNYMDPDLFFYFRLPPKYDEIQTMLNSLDEGERNKQVFGLLILNKFMPITGGNVTNGGSNVVATNSTEVLSNQLSSWLSKISNDFDVGVRYNPGDNITSDEVELALSSQFFNNRVLLETNFGISGATNTTNSTKSNTFVGEFTISYKINKKGNIVGKVFNRSNELNPVNQNISPYTQGIGLAYTEPFRNGKNLGCILSNHFKKSENKRNCTDEYYQQQVANKEENLEQIKRRVARSRKKHEKQKRKQEAKLAKQKTNS